MRRWCVLAHPSNSTWDTARRWDNDIMYHPGYIYIVVCMHAFHTAVQTTTAKCKLVSVLYLDYSAWIHVYIYIAMSYRVLEHSKDKHIYKVSLVRERQTVCVRLYMQRSISVFTNLLKKHLGFLFRWLYANGIAIQHSTKTLSDFNRISNLRINFTICAPATFLPRLSGEAERSATAVNIGESESMSAASQHLDRSGQAGSTL